MAFATRWCLNGLSRLEGQAVESLTRSLSERFSNRVESMVLLGLDGRPSTPDREIQVLVILDEEDPAVEAQITDEVLDLLLDTGVYLSVKCLTRRQYRVFEKMRLPLLNPVGVESIPLYSGA